MGSVLIDIKNNKYSDSEMVAILELTAYKLNLKTISDKAREENKSPNGIRKSNCYRKIKIGSIVLCTGKLRDTNLPF